MKTSSRIFWGFWGAAALMLIVPASAAIIVRLRLSPNRYILRDLSVGPWEKQTLLTKNFSRLQLHGAFDVEWEHAAYPRVVLSIPRQKKDEFSVQWSSDTLHVRSHLSGRFAQLALRLKIQSPILREVKTDQNLKLHLVGFPGNTLEIVGKKAVWLEGECPPLDELKLRSYGMTVLRMTTCPVKNLELYTQGRMDVDADVTERIEGEVHGDGWISLKHAPATDRLITFGTVKTHMH